MPRETVGATHDVAPENVTALLRHNVRLDRVTYRPLAELRSYDRKLRRRSAAALKELMNSITSFGLVAPILLDEQGVIIAGEGLVEAARALKMVEVPTLRIEHLDDAEVRLLRIALNRLAETSEWDRIELAAEFDELLSMDLEIDYEVTGFHSVEIDNLVHAPADDDPDDEPEPIGDAQSAVTRLGDMWLLGRHRVICGSSLESSVLAAVMGGDKARMVLTDAPFNVRIANNVSGLGKNKHREFVQASGEMSEAEFIEFLSRSTITLAD